MTFFGQHRLTLDDALNRVLFQDPQDNLVVLLARLRPNELWLRARYSLSFELFKVFRQLAKHVTFNLRC